MRAAAPTAGYRWLPIHSEGQNFRFMYQLFNNIPPVYLIYFFYGGAFLFLSASIANKRLAKSSTTKE